MCLRMSMFFRIKRFYIPLWLYYNPKWDECFNNKDFLLHSTLVILQYVDEAIQQLAIKDSTFHSGYITIEEEREEIFNYLILHSTLVILQ